jgi:8-oxo-dGTP pyrophosphatase MutT (NUDIX family)
VRTSRSKLVYDGRLIKLYRETVRLPNGASAELEIIKHPGAALIVPFLSKDTVLMLRQYRHAAGGYLYEFPAGTREAAESLRNCAMREIVEETGHSAGKLTLLGDIVPVPGYSTERIRIFKAERLLRSRAALEADEVATVFSAGRKKIARLFETRRIIDAKTICALAMINWI